MRERFLSFRDTARHLFSARHELRVDGRNWNELVGRKTAEAEANGLAQRFVDSNPRGVYYFTIVARDSHAFIFYDLLLNGEDNSPTSQAIVLDANNEPRYAYEVEALGDLEKFWSVSGQGEDVEIIGNVFYNLGKAKLFDSRKSNRRWGGGYPDVDGLIKELELVTDHE